MSASPTLDLDRSLKPHALLPDPDTIPQELKALQQWVVWCYEPNDDHDKWTKVPKNPKMALQGHNRNASSTNTKSWGTFEQAWEAYLMHPPMAGDVPMPNDKTEMGNSGLDGIGLMLGADNPYCGVDLDKCLEDGQLVNDDAREALELLSGTYTEVSPSGTGIRIFCVATKPGKKCKTGTREMYDQSGGRFLTLTGHIYGEPCGITDKQEVINTLYARWFTERAKAKASPGASTTYTTENNTPLEDELLLERMFASKRGAAIKALWEGDTSAYAKDENDGQSEADQALTNHLAWWADYELERIDKLFRQSGLYRPKWDEMRGAQTYGQMTIDKALEGKGRGDGYNGVRSDDSGPQSDDSLTWGELQPLPPGRPPAPNMPPVLVPEALRGWLVDASERMSTRLELLTPPALVSLVHPPTSFLPLLTQWPPSIGPLERLGHSGVEVVDEVEDALTQV